MVRPGYLVVMIQEPGLVHLKGAPGLNSDFLVVLYYQSRVESEIMMRIQIYDNLGLFPGKSDRQTQKHRTPFIPSRTAEYIFLV